MARPPQLKRINLGGRAGAIPARSIFAPGSMRGAERPLLHQFIGEQTLAFGTRAIALAAPSITAGYSAWFKIASFKIPDDIGAEGAMVGYRIEIGPGNKSALDPDFVAGGLSQTGYGDNDAQGLAVVLGLNLPGGYLTWSSGPANVPHVELPSDGATRAAQWPLAQWKTFHWAPGQLSDNPVATVYRVGQFAPLGQLLNSGATLDVSVVMRRSFVNGITGTYPMRIFGELSIASALTRGQFTE